MTLVTPDDHNSHVLVPTEYLFLGYAMASACAPVKIIRQESGSNCSTSWQQIAALLAAVCSRGHIFTPANLVYGKPPPPPVGSWRLPSESCDGRGCERSVLPVATGKQSLY